MYLVVDSEEESDISKKWTTKIILKNTAVFNDLDDKYKTSNSLKTEKDDQDIFPENIDSKSSHEINDNIDSTSIENNEYDVETLKSNQNKKDCEEFDVPTIHNNSNQTYFQSSVVAQYDEGDIDNRTYTNNTKEQIYLDVNDYEHSKGCIYYKEPAIPKIEVHSSPESVRQGDFSQHSCYFNTDYRSPCPIHDRSLCRYHDRCLCQYHDRCDYVDCYRHESIGPEYTNSYELHEKVQEVPMKISDKFQATPCTHFEDYVKINESSKDRGKYVVNDKQEFLPERAVYENQAQGDGCLQNSTPMHIFPENDSESETTVEENNEPPRKLNITCLHHISHVFSATFGATSSLFHSMFTFGRNVFSKRSNI